VPSFVRHLRAANKSPRTIEAYQAATNLLAQFLVERPMPTVADPLRRS
jgi:hypothetical protein